MASVANNQIDVRGCPASVRFTVDSADTWVAVLLDYAHKSGATRVAVNINGGGKLAHAETPGSTVASSDDYHPMPDGQSYYFDLDPASPVPLLQVAVDADGSAVAIHVTSSPLAHRWSCGCRR